MRAVLILLSLCIGMALVCDGLNFVNRTLFLDNYLPFGLQYTTLKFAIADRSTVETVGYGIALFGAMLIGFSFWKMRRP